ncbi:copper amine oxidase N-terminal domain-containing protein [Lutibacter sp. B2]|nr:copper amine oxidase N-terminal domain-containing protein [Lutibacter sp. B2]
MKKFSSMILVLTLIFSMAISASAVDNIKVTIDGTPVAFDAPPQIVDGRTLVPMRAIFEALGATIGWNDQTKTVTSSINGVDIALGIGNKIASKNGNKITLDVPPQLISARTFVPVRFIGEASGSVVNWDNATKTVLITTNQGKMSEADYSKKCSEFIKAYEELIDASSELLANYEFTPEWCAAYIDVEETSIQIADQLTEVTPAVPDIYLESHVKITSAVASYSDYFKAIRNMIDALNNGNTAEADKQSAISDKLFKTATDLWYSAIEIN